MAPVTLHARTDAEGRLHLDLPTMRDAEVEVTVVARPADDVPRDAMGWPIGFWEKYVGKYPDAPDEPEDLPLVDDVDLD